MSRQEFTGFRDEPYSRRHREYGNDCPCTDLDILLHSDGTSAPEGESGTSFLEYDRLKPVALIEAKNIKSMWPFRKSEWCQVVALNNLAKAAGKQFFIVRYDERDWSYIVHRIDDRGNINEGAHVSELEFVRALYTLRGRELPEDIASKLYTTRLCGDQP